MKRPELLAPAGSMEALRAAVTNGADAVYLGATRFGARAFAGNFDDEQLIEAVRYCHEWGVKVYVTVNTLIYEEELDAAMELVDFLYHADVDALILQDLGLTSRIRSAYPDFELHASTQMHIHNREGVRRVKALGMKRAVLARETPIELVRSCTEEGIDLEIFVYGALCVCYSGECLMSSINGGRSGNRGQCAQPCRMAYQLIKQNTGEVLETEGEYLLSPRDLNTLEHVQELIESGAASFKIEGRMKRPEYVGAVVRTWRKRIDEVLARKHGKITPEEEIRLKKLFNRGFTDGYLFHQQGPALMNAVRPNHVGIQAGTVLSQKNGRVQVRLDHPIQQQDGLRILRNEAEDIGFTVNYLYKNGLLVSHAEARDLIELDVREKVSPGAKLLQTTDSRLMKEIQDTFGEPCRRVSVDFHIEAQPGHPLVLTLTDKKGRQVRSETIMKCSPAEKAPLDETRIRQQMNKIKDTPYQIAGWSCELKGDVFLPMQQLNEVRRHAVAQLSEIRRLSYPERAGRQPLMLSPLCLKPIQFKPELIVQIQTKEQAEALKDLDIRLVSAWPALIREYPDTIYPSALRVQEQPSPFAADWLQCEEIGGLENPSSALSLTSGFNVTNSEALALLLSQPRVTSVQFSLEADLFQQQAITEAFQKRYGYQPPVIQLVYGRRDLMVSKACPVNRTLSDGQKKNCRLCHQHTYVLQSVKKEQFPLLGDAACYSHLLEKTPYECPAEEMNPHWSWKVLFTLESGDESRKRILRLLKQRKTMSHS